MKSQAASARPNLQTLTVVGKRTIFTTVFLSKGVYTFRLMTSAPILLDLLLAAIPWTVGMVITIRLIWPRWKIVGKAIAYFGVMALLSWLIGHWSLLVAFLHQGLGMAFHIGFCRRHGFRWYAVEDPERYTQLSKQMVGHSPD